MPLQELTLFGKRNKVDIAIQRLKQFEPSKGYYLAFSGGKDSVTILCLAQMANVKFDAHYNNTTVDPPELVTFIKKQHPQVERHRPEMSMFQYILKVEHWPPMRNQRWCCKRLKEYGGSGRLVLTGIRWQESYRRKKRRMIEACYSDKTKTFLHPIIDWTNNEVWEFIHTYNIPYCSLYDKGLKRLGCVLCPMNRHPELDIYFWPQYKKAYVNTFTKLIEVRKKVGKKITFETGEDLFNWWISQKRSSKIAPGQMVLFE